MASWDGDLNADVGLNRRDVSGWARRCWRGCHSELEGDGLLRLCGFLLLFLFATTVLADEVEVVFFCSGFGNA